MVIWQELPRFLALMAENMTDTQIKYGAEKWKQVKEEEYEDYLYVVGYWIHM